MRHRLSLLAATSLLASGCLGIGLFELNRTASPIDANATRVTVTYESRSRHLTHWQVDKDNVAAFLKKLALEDGQVRDRTHLSATLNSPVAGRPSSCVACTWLQVDTDTLPPLNGGDTLFISHPLEPGSHPERAPGFSYKPIYPAPRK